MAVVCSFFFFFAGPYRTFIFLRSGWWLPAKPQETLWKSTSARVCSFHTECHGLALHRCSQMFTFSMLGFCAFSCSLNTILCSHFMLCFLVFAKMTPAWQRLLIAGRFILQLRISLDFQQKVLKPPPFLLLFERNHLLCLLITRVYLSTNCIWH